MPEITLYHGSSAYFKRPDPAFSKEGMAHSEYGWGFYTATDGNTSIDYGGANTDSVMYSYKIDKEWIEKSMLLSDKPIGQDKYNALIGTIKDVPINPVTADKLSPILTGNQVIEILRGTELDINYRSAAEAMANHGIKGFWSEYNDSVVFFDFDDVPESRIHQISGDMPEARSAHAKQHLDDLKAGVAQQSPEFQEVFQKFLDQAGVDLDNAQSIEDIPNGRGLISAFHPDYPNPSYIKGNIDSTRNPEMRELLGQMYNILDPERAIRVQSVPENQVDKLSLRQRVELDYYDDHTGLRKETLKAVYETGDEALIDAVEKFANSLEKGSFSTIGSDISNNLEAALGASYYTMPDTPDKMAEHIKLGYRTSASDDVRALVDNIKEAMISYGEKVHGVPSEARLAAAEAEALANARNNPNELLRNGEFMSSSLSFAHFNAMSSNNEDLLTKFEDLTKHLLSDEYNKRGLPDNGFGATQHQNNGFSLRDGIGNAFSKMMSDGGLDDDYIGGHAMWQRNREYFLDSAGNDPKLLQKFGELEESLFDHLEKVNGVRPPEMPTMRNPWVRSVDDTVDAFRNISDFSLLRKIGQNGGAVTGVVIGGLVGAFTLATGGTPAQAAEITYETAVPYGETQLDLSRGDLEAAQRSATIETASNAGALGGAALGAAAGSVVPVVGTAAGALVGGVVGALGGGVAVGEATAYAYDHADDIADYFDGSDDRLFERLPHTPDDTMSPELQHLVEIKSMWLYATEQREALGNGRTRDQGLIEKRSAAGKAVSRAEEMYDKAYDDYQENDMLSEAISALEAWEAQNPQTQIAEVQQQIKEPITTQNFDLKAL